jgi:hypothetical protein
MFVIVLAISMLVLFIGVLITYGFLPALLVVAILYLVFTLRGIFFAAGAVLLVLILYYVVGVVDPPWGNGLTLLLYLALSGVVVWLVFLIWRNVSIWVAVAVGVLLLLFLLLAGPWHLGHDQSKGDGSNPYIEEPVETETPNTDSQPPAATPRPKKRQRVIVNRCTDGSKISRKYACLNDGMQPQSGLDPGDLGQNP